MSKLDGHVADSDSDTPKEVDSINDDSSSEASSTNTSPVRTGQKKKTSGKQRMK